MAHYARLNLENIVEQVIVVSNDDEQIDGIEVEEKGIAFCQKLTGYQNWKKTSYNGTMRKNFAGVGSFYDATRDAFIPPKPFPSWVLDEENCRWIAPLPMPNDEKMYRWDEDNQMWVELS